MHVHSISNDYPIGYVLHRSDSQIVRQRFANFNVIAVEQSGIRLPSTRTYMSRGCDSVHFEDMGQHASHLDKEKKGNPFLNPHMAGFSRPYPDRNELTRV